MKKGERWEEEVGNRAKEVVEVKWCWGMTGKMATSWHFATLAESGMVDGVCLQR